MKLSAHNAVAYSVINANRFNEERNKNSLEAIKKQLNIPTSGQYSNKPAGGQYFSKPHTPSNQTNIDDLESKVEELEEEVRYYEDNEGYTNDYDWYGVSEKDFC